MLSIQNNLMAMAANHQLKLNSGKAKKTTEKLSSGYRINRAADDAAGLAISEKMRRQLRGLTQGTANAQNGISFVQVADGSMDEVHQILQRMNEISIQSLNGTLTESDRAALNAEFDQLRTEIDRISSDTSYNEQPVFEEHESSFYQIAGSKRWNDNQLHTISALTNELNIHLPQTYQPSEYSLTVPAGVYTTQELIDEIDSALENMQPTNPGFVLEYTSNGFCNVNFESANGMPTEISSVDGSLSYLLYDSNNGSASTSLLGTTVFDAKYPLNIISGQNDELKFYIESPGSSNLISMKIPAGQYLRSEIIDLINQNLVSNPNAAGITAKEYGSSSVQITGGDTISITGLKGNMFKLETTSIVYSSIFYDNVKYGSSNGGTAASISGKAYYISSNGSDGLPITDKIYLSGANQNNVLRFKVNDAADYTEITFPEKADGYTIKEISEEINKQLKDKGLGTAVSAGLGNTYISIPYSATSTSSYYASYLTVTSLLKGSKSSLEFDTTSGSLYANTYNALFKNTNYFPRTFKGTKASLTGYADLSGSITLPANASLTFQVNNQSYTIDNIDQLGSNPISRADLIDQLNNYIQTDAAFSAIKDKIAFHTSGTGICIDALTNDIQRISFNNADQNETYKKLFAGYTDVTNSYSSSCGDGSVKRPQGSTAVTVTDAFTYITVPADRANSPISIDKDHNKLTFSLNGSNKTITLTAKTYQNLNAILSDINSQFAGSSDAALRNVKASYENGKMMFTATPPSNTPDGDYKIGYIYGTAIRPIVGTHPQITQAYSKEVSKSILRTTFSVPDSVSVTSSNNVLTLTLGSDASAVTSTISIPPGNDMNKESLKNAIQNAIDNDASLKNKVTVSLTNDGRLDFSAHSYPIKASGSFYEEIVMSKKEETETKRNGSYTDTNFSNAYIIGRKDLKAAPVEIVSGGNDLFTFDFAYVSASAANQSYEKTMDIQIPEGTYSGDEIASFLQDKINEKFAEEGIEDFEVKVTVGGIQTNVVGSNDDTALQIVVNRKSGKEPDAGQYVLDGIRGSAASFLFYKTTNEPTITSLSGTKNLSNGIHFKPGQNVLTLSVDSVPYSYTFPENTQYTAHEFADLLNTMFQNGDDNGNTAPLKASIENGTLKLSHKVAGSHTITDIGGSARNILFLQESSRKFKEPIYLLVGSETRDLVEIPRTRINSCSLAINSITISQPKYAEKAVARIKNAISLVSSRRSTYGAMQNRLEHTINKNNNVIENTQASESAIRDADIAKETMELAKDNFMLQANQVMLAQANQLPNFILNLLK